MGHRPTGDILGLDQTVMYEIVVAGRLGDDWSEWLDPRARIERDMAIDNTRIWTVLDQAGLHGLLRRLYSVGLPLLSVRVCRRTDVPAKKNEA